MQKYSHQNIIFTSALLLQQSGAQSELHEGGRGLKTKAVSVEYLSSESCDE